MKKYLFILLLLAVLAFTSCNSTATVSSSEDLASESSVDSDYVSSEDIVSTVSSEEVLEEDEPETTNNVGGEDYCYAHKWVYHSFETELIEYIGWDEFNAWSSSCEDTCSSNIVAFVKYFDISKEELIAIQEEECAGLDESFWDAVYEAYGMTEDEYMGSMMLSDEQIDAIYSGDEALIETLFSGALAVDAEDGNRYSITWLESHSAEDYASAGISADSLEDMVSLIAEDDEYQKYRTEVASISEQMTEAIMLMEVE